MRSLSRTVFCGVVTGVLLCAGIFVSSAASFDNFDQHSRRTRLVEGERWHLVLSADASRSEALPGSVLGYVARQEDGAWFRSPLLAPGTEAFFPTDGVVPELDDHGTPFGSLTPPDFYISLRITNDEGPFSLAMDLKVVDDSRDALTYLVTPECNSFPLTWSAAGQSYVRGEPVCAGTAGTWGAASPFQGDEFVPVARYRRELMREAGAPWAGDLKAGEDAQVFTWEAFVAFFDEDAAVFLRRVYADWRLHRDFVLRAHTGSPEAFVRESAELTEPVTEFMHEVLRAGFDPSPDESEARLSALLAPLHRRFLVEQENPKAAGLSLVHSENETPWLSAVAARQLLRLARTDGRPEQMGQTGQAENRQKFLNNAGDESTPERHSIRTDGGLIQFLPSGY